MLRMSWTSVPADAPMHKILILPGDGIGPEVVAEAAKVLVALQQRHGLDVELLAPIRVEGPLALPVGRGHGHRTVVGGRIGDLRALLGIAAF